MKALVTLLASGLLGVVAACGTSTGLSPASGPVRRRSLSPKQNPAACGVLPFSTPDGGGSGGSELSKRAL